MGKFTSLMLGQTVFLIQYRKLLNDSCTGQRRMGWTRNDYNLCVFRAYGHWSVILSSIAVSKLMIIEGGSYYILLTSVLHAIVWRSRLRKPRLMVIRRYLMTSFSGCIAISRPLHPVYHLQTIYPWCVIWATSVKMVCYFSHCRLFSILKSCGMICHSLCNWDIVLHFFFCSARHAN